MTCYSTKTHFFAARITSASLEGRLRLIDDVLYLTDLSETWITYKTCFLRFFFPCWHDTITEEQIGFVWRKRQNNWEWLQVRAKLVHRAKLSNSMPSHSSWWVLTVYTVFDKRARGGSYLQDKTNSVEVSIVQKKSTWWTDDTWLLTTEPSAWLMTHFYCFSPY